MSSSSGITSPVKAAIQGNKGSGAQIVQIIRLPNALQNSAKSIRLDGQITSQNPNNNTVSIQTDQGNIDVKIKGGRQPAVGQKVEIEVPPNRQQGNQTRQATIRTDAPSQNNSTQNTTTANTGNTPSPQTNNNPTLANKVTTPNTTQQAAQSNVPPRVNTSTQQPNVQTSNTQPTNNTQINQATGQTNPQAQTSPNQPAEAIARNTTNLLQTVRNFTAQLLPSTLQESLLSPKQVSTTLPPTTTITPETLVRLISVTPLQAQSIAKEFSQILPPPLLNIVGKNAFQTNITANIPTQTAQPAIQSPTQSSLLQPQFSTPLPNNAVNNAPSQPLLNNNVISQTSFVPTAPTTQSSLQATTFLNPSVYSNSQPLTQNQINVANSTSILPTPQAAATNTNTPQPSIQNASLVPINFDPANPAQNNTQRLAQIDIQILKITPPTTTLKPVLPTGTPPPSPIPAATFFQPVVTSNNTATTLTGQITGFTNQGLPLVTVQGLGARLPQSFILQASNPNLQLGSQLQIVPRSAVPVAGQVSPLTLQTLNNPLLQGFQWPALDELYIALQQLAPQAALSLSRALPNAATPAQIGPAAMMFIAAVRSGDIANWLGDKKIDMLQQAGRRNILNNLTQDAARTAAPEAATSSEWRAVPMPLFWENEIHRIMLYTRQENNEQQQDNNKDGQTRFIFDLSLSRMGDVQIDGLIKDKRLDLVVRTQNAFSEPMQQTMRRAYTNTLDQTDLGGELNFQGSTEKWVHVLEKQEQLGVNV